MPVSLETAKSFLRIDSDALDDEVRLLLDAAIEDVEAAASTRLLTVSIVHACDRFAELAHLPIGPVREIVSISYRDAAGATQTLAPAAYQLIGHGLERGIAPLAPWPAGCEVRATLSVGYGDAADDVPAKLRWAVLALVRGKFEDQPVDIAPLIYDFRVWG